jgi:predicted site-specific integrase-resolvase
MTLNEIFELYNNNWSEASRELKIPPTTLQKWRKKGYIPLPSQRILEHRSNKVLIARFEDTPL